MPISAPSFRPGVLDQSANQDKNLVLRLWATVLVWTRFVGGCSRSPYCTCYRTAGIAVCVQSTWYNLQSAF